MQTVEIKQLVGQFRESATGKVRNIGWNMDRVFLGGRQIATINRVPGAAIGLFSGVLLTSAERTAIETAIAAVRGGVKPCKIGGPIDLPYELLDDEDTDTDEGDNE